MKTAAILFMCAIASATAQNLEDTPKLEADQKPVEKRFAKQKLDGWGTALDLAGDCKFEAKDGGLVMTVPGGKAHDLSTELLSSTAPRVLRPLSGDFSIQVKVEGEFRPGADSSQPGRSGYRGAGLVVFADAKNYVRLERATLEWKGEEPQAYTNFEIRVDGELQRIGTTGDAALDPKKPTWLRLERVGSILQGAVSQDGKEWKALAPKELTEVWKKETLGGIAAISTSQEEFTPRYSEFSLTEK
jgi:regulation of enolase protein 1 (concanavalin A-like superfamily)